MYTGGCLCESIKYLVNSRLDILVNCHCQYCRTAHGAEFVPVAIIESKNLEILEGKDLLASYEVPNVEAFRCFCVNCGTRLFNHSPAAGITTVITATLINSSNLIPIANVNMESCREGFDQLNGLPNFDAIPDGSELKRLSREANHKK